MALASSPVLSGAVGLPRVIRRRRKYFLGVAFFAVLLSVAACSSSGSSGSAGAGSGSSSTPAKPIALGTSNAITGAVAATCKPTTDGAKAWFDQVNANGGINGRQITYQVLDDAYDPARAVANAKTLVDNKVVAAVSGCGTANSQAMNAGLKAAGIPQVMPYSSIPNLVKDTSTLFFAGLPLYGRQISGVATYAMKNLGAGSLAMVSPVQPGSTEFVDAAQTAAKGAGGSWLGVQNVTNGQADYTPTILKLKQQNPDYVIIALGAGDAAKVMKAGADQGFRPAKAWLGYSSMADPALLTALGSANVGKVVVGTPIALTGSTASKACEDAIKAHAEASADVALGIYGCSVAQIVTKVMGAMKGEITSQTFIKALESTSNQQLADALPPITLSAQNHSGVNSITILQASDGKFSAVGSADLPAA